MIAQHTIKVNGKWFYAGNKIAEVEKSTSDFSKHMTTPEEWKVTQENTRTKTKINRMSTAELKNFAMKQGVDNAENMTGAELKKVLIEKLGL